MRKNGTNYKHDLIYLKMSFIKKTKEFFYGIFREVSAKREVCQQRGKIPEAEQTDSVKK